MTKRLEEAIAENLRFPLLIFQVLRILHKCFQTFDYFGQAASPDKRTQMSLAEQKFFGTEVFDGVSRLAGFSTAFANPIPS